MAISKKVESYLKKMKLKAEVIEHKTVFTVYDLAQTLRAKFESIAKTLLVKVDKGYVLVVMPANYRLDMKKLKKTLGVKKVSLAQEKEMKSKFNVKPGAMLPFGLLHNLEVVVDTSLLKTKEALFGAGSFTESLRIKVKDYVNTTKPRLAAVANKVALKLQPAAKQKKHKAGKKRKRVSKSAQTRKIKKTTKRKR